METVNNRSVGDLAVISSTAEATGNGAALAVAVVSLVRSGSVTINVLFDAYMAEYSGQDGSLPQRLDTWRTKLGGSSTLLDLDGDDDRIDRVLEELSTEHGRYYAGRDADGKSIFKGKRKLRQPGTINRYLAALQAVLSWAVRRRIPPRGWNNPCKTVMRRRENNGVVRFLSQGERTDLLAACKRSKWSMLYAFVLLALTTGARRGELEQLRWRDLHLDLEREGTDQWRPIATLNRSKNGDGRVLPLTAITVKELRRHQGSPDTLIFASKRNPSKPYNFTPAWKLALKQAGVKNFRVHDLRHTAASYLAQAGTPLLTIAETLGHRNLATTRRYSHLAIEHKAAVVNKILGGIE